MTTAIFGYQGFSTSAARAPRLRLTQRGRGVLLVIVATPFVIAALFFALNGGRASAALESPNTSLQYINVDAGESLWGVAQEIAPNADPRDVIQQIIELNQLNSADVFAGVRLAIPAQYAH